jgi:hypothetical protein
MGAASVTKAMRRMSVPPLGQVSGSDSNSRASRIAQRERAEERAPGVGAAGATVTAEGGFRFAGASIAAARGSELGARTPVTMAVPPRWRDEARELVAQLQGRAGQRRGAIALGSG